MVPPLKAMAPPPLPALLTTKCSWSPRRCRPSCCLGESRRRLPEAKLLTKVQFVMVALGVPPPWPYEMTPPLPAA
jgi:hypothetical protein